MFPFSAIQRGLCILVSRRFGSVSLPECAFRSLPICGQWAMVRLALPSRLAALREQPQSGALCTRRPTTRSRSSPPSIWSLAEPQINVLAGYVAGFPAWAYSTRILLAEKVAGWWTCSKNRWEAGTRIKCVLLEAAVPTAQVAFVPSIDRACGKGGSCDGHSNIADWRALLRRLNDKDARSFA